MVHYRRFHLTFGSISANLEFAVEFFGCQGRRRRGLRSKSTSQRFRNGCGRRRTGRTGRPHDARVRRASAFLRRRGVDVGFEGIRRRGRRRRIQVQGRHRVSLRWLTGDEMLRADSQSAANTIRRYSIEILEVIKYIAFYNVKISVFSESLRISE